MNNLETHYPEGKKYETNDFGDENFFKMVEDILNNQKLNFTV